MRNYSLILLLGLFVVSPGIHGQDLDFLPQYAAGQTVSGTIRLWGNDQMLAVAKQWQKGFQKYHPDIKFETNLMGTGTGMAGLYSGVADLALMGRASTPKEIMAFEWVFGYKPLGIEVMTGSLDAPGKSPALAVFVHKDNPLSRLTLAQLDAVFGCEHRRGLDNIRTWGQLGLEGEWKDKPINIYSYDAETGTAAFFRETVLNGSRKWNWERMKEFKDVKNPDGSTYESSQQILNVLATDRYGIGIASLRRGSRNVKPVALASRNGEPAYEATQQNLVQRKYPLTRVASVYINRQPGRQVDAKIVDAKIVDPKIKEFLRYVLSREGQQDIVRVGDYLPLPKEVVIQQIEKLE
jgi:phosphate transport system substrate-binding protein